jgi:hypothetical protein
MRCSLIGRHGMISFFDWSNSQGGGGGRGYGPQGARKGYEGGGGEEGGKRPNQLGSNQDWQAVSPTKTFYLQPWQIEKINPKEQKECTYVTLQKCNYVFQNQRGTLRILNKIHM